MIRYKAFHKMSYGLYIISTCYNEVRSGYIGNTAFQVTSVPAQIAISCHKNNASAERILKSKIFSLSVLKKDADTSLIGTFGFMSSADVDKFQNVRTKTAATGAPIVLDSSLAWFDCKVVDTLDVGTHLLIIGIVQDSDIISDGEPLTYDYYREKYKMLAPKNAPTYIDIKKIQKEEAIIKNAGDKSQPPVKFSKNNKPSVYSCSICGFRYNPAKGDPKSGIPPGTLFKDLPGNYKCPVCNAGKEFFKKN